MRKCGESRVATRLETWKTMLCSRPRGLGAVVDARNGVCAMASWCAGMAWLVQGRPEAAFWRSPRSL